MIILFLIIITNNYKTAGQRIIRNLDKKLSAFITKFDKTEIFKRLHIAPMGGGERGDVKLEST